VNFLRQLELADQRNQKISLVKADGEVNLNPTDLLAAQATDPDSTINSRKRAARKLVELGDPRGGDALVAIAYLPEKTLVGRRLTAEMLAKLGDARGADMLAEIAADWEARSVERRLAAEMLIKLGDPRGFGLYSAASRYWGSRKRHLKYLPDGTSEEGSAGERNAPSKEGEIKPDNGGFQHFVDKGERLKTVVTTLCGWTWVLQSANGVVDLPVCPRCQEVYDHLPPG
jgi:hypothetical protein